MSYLIFGAAVVSPFLLLGWALCRTSANADRMAEGWEAERAERAKRDEANERVVSQAFADHAERVWIDDGRSAVLPYATYEDMLRDREDQGAAS